MASINFQQPSRISDQKKYIYSDIHLDMTEDKSTTAPDKSDIKVDYDINAIKNSIRSIFNTRKGERPLYPEFGSSLEHYVFEPINATTANSIGRDIQKGIATYEPRVTLINIDIKVLSTEDGYEITIQLFIPKLNINILVDSILANGGLSVK